jgi:hypothetical protein
MKLASLISLSIIAAGVSALVEVIEPQDFDVEAALENIGIDLSTLPQSEAESSTLNTRSSTASCSLAVSTVDQVPLILHVLTIEHSVLL